MKYTEIQTAQMLEELEQYFSYVTRLHEGTQTISFSFPERTVSEKTALRISLDCSNQTKKGDSELHMMSMHDHDIKAVKKITGLKLKSFNAFVYTKRHTQLVSMFE